MGSIEKIEVIEEHKKRANSINLVKTTCKTCGHEWFGSGGYIACQKCSDNENRINGMLSFTGKE